MLLARRVRRRSLEGTIRTPISSKTPPAQDEGARERVRELCAATLAANWVEGSREGVEFAYTRPSPERYPWQWYWDSCFSAIVWRRFDVDRSHR